MKKIAIIMVIVTIGIAVSVFMEWTAWNDVFDVYVSSRVTAHYAQLFAGAKIPQWASCSLEIKLLQAAFLIRLVSVAILFFTAAITLAQSVSRTKIFILIAPVGILVGFVLGWGAGTDIFHDYVSSATLDSLGLVSCKTALPQWVSCKMEWAALQAGWFIRMGSIALLYISVIAGYISGRPRREPPQGKLS